MNMLTLSKNFFTSFFHISRWQKRKKKQKKSLSKQQLFAECYLIIIYILQNNESKKQLFRIYLPVKLVYGKMSIKQGKFSSYPCSYVIYKIFILSYHRWLEKGNPPFIEDKMDMNLNIQKIYLNMNIQKIYLRIPASILNKLR